MAQIARTLTRGQSGTLGDKCPRVSPWGRGQRGHTPLGVSLSVPLDAPNEGQGTGTAKEADHRKGDWLPDPSDVSERAALIEEGDAISREEAETRALAEHGFPSWSAFALLHADRITLELECLPAACDAIGARLLGGTLKLLTGPHWLAAVSAGWPLIDVFGVAEWMPHERPDVLGLVPRVAFNARKGRRLERITEAGAEFREPDGRLVLYRRPSLTADVRNVVPWWQSPVIVNREAA